MVISLALPIFQDHRVKFNIVSSVLEIELSPAGDIDQTQRFSASTPGALSRVGCPCELFSAGRSCLPSSGGRRLG